MLKRNFSLLDAAAMELFPGEEHMRDERGSSVSLFHISQRALGVRFCRFWFVLGWGFLFVCCLVCVSFTLCFLLHNYCKRIVYCQLGPSFSHYYRHLLTVRAFVRVRLGLKKKSLLLSFLQIIYSKNTR